MSPIPTRIPCGSAALPRRAVALCTLAVALLWGAAALCAAGLTARMLLQVHDELLFEAAEAEADETARVAREVMQAAASLTVPLVVETGQGRTWAQAH